jgi:tetratricopeptide (TPR) repeat protein
MKIVTMTLCHADAALKLTEAISSARFADAHLVVDTSPERPEVREAVGRIVGAGRNVVLRSWTWQNDFALARNHLSQQASTLIIGETWGVVLDSDERFVCADPDALRSELAQCHDVQTCMMPDVDGFYTKERFFRLPTAAKYIGPTHEACIDTGKIHTIQSMRFWEIPKNAQEYQHKLRRDVTILRKHTKQNPCDPRWWYYLGDTLDSLGNKPEAIEAFMSCAKLNGWDEESAWACYRAATILLEKERYREAINTCAMGIARHPGVPELCWIAAVASFRSNARDKASYWARMAITMGDHCGAKVSGTRIGFRHLPALYELPYDILRFALPTQEERDEAERDFWAAKFHRYGGTAETIALRRTQDSARYEARNDIGRRVKSLSELSSGVRIVPISNPSQDGYHCMNPSVCVHRGKLITSIRTVNYVIDDLGRYVIPQADAGVVKTTNYLADVSPGDYAVSNIRTVADQTGKSRFTTMVRGYEDLRLASIGDQLYASATVRDHKPNMPCEIAVCRLQDDGTIPEDWLQSSPRDEKNWMPIVHEGRLSFLYSMDPTVVLRFDQETGMCQETARSTPSLALDHMRGGSQVIAVPGQGWLAVTHEVVILDDRRRYLHRFVRLDDGFRVTHVSNAWRIRPLLSVEFVAGMALYEGKIILSAGLDDNEACFVVLNVDEALRLASELPVSA